MFSKKNIFVSTPIAYIISLLLSSVWLILILVGPLLFKMPSDTYYIGNFYYQLFHFTCHQQPARCYWIFDYQLPVCVRCLGIYLGVFIALILYPAFKKVTSTKMPNKWWLLLCFIPIGIDGISSAMRLYASPHWLRLLTGLLCGGIAMLFILPGFNDAVRIIQEE